MSDGDLAFTSALSPGAQSLANAAAGQESFVPGPDQIAAVIFDLGSNSAVHRLFIEARCCGLTVTLPDAATCAGEPGILTATVTDGVAPLTYVWKDSAKNTVQTTSPTSSASDTLSANASATYTVIVTDGNGCVASDSAAFTVHPEPACSITPSNPTICEGTAVELCGPDGMASYSWNTGAIDKCITVGTAGTYTLTITERNGCSSTCSVNVTVNPNPTCSIIGGTVLCEGSTTSLCGPDGMASYAWHGPEQDSAISQCIKVGTPGTYTLTIIDDNGCSNNCSTTVTISDTSSPVIACPGNIVSNATSSAGAIVTFNSPVASDNCKGSIPSTCDPPSGSVFPIGNTIVKCNVADGSGNPASCSFTVTVNSSGPAKPTVTIQASDATASEPGVNTGQFKVTRTGPISASLKVFFTVGGTATYGIDYTPLPDSVTIRAGKRSATFKVKPLNDKRKEPTEKVIATLATKRAYVIGTPRAATVNIVDND